MARPRLIINGRDLGQYLRVGEDDFDPSDPDYAEPQFSGSPAFTEGAEYTSDAIGNREWTIPLLLDAASRSALHQLIRDINNDLFRGAQVEFAVDPDVDESSFFDLERGRLDVQFEYMLSVHSTQRATLRLWTRPYAHTGTIRSVLPSAHGTGVIERMATGILGDTDALGNLLVRVGSRIPTFNTASQNYLVSWGVSRNPSHVGMVHAASTTLSGVGTIIGASGAIGSMYRGYDLPATAVGQIAAVWVATAQTGPNRVFAVMRSRLHPATALRVHGALNRPGLVFTDTPNPGFGATAIATVNDGRWMIADLGVVYLPTTRETETKQLPAIAIYVGGASGASVVASPSVHIQGFVMMPLEGGAGAVNITATPRADAWVLRPRTALSARTVPRTQVVMHPGTTGTPSEVNADVTGRLRGNPPHIPPVGSPAASGPSRVVVFAGDAVDFRGNDVLTTEMSVRERFRFLR